MLLSQLNYFRAVAHHQHISHAAEELRVAQPALSSTISKLEKELGVPLFDRIGRNIILNDAGQRLLHHADYIFTQLDALNAALQQTDEFHENEFTLSVSNSMFLNGWLQQFVLDNPKIRLCQKMLSEEQMLEALLDESVDVALGEFDEDLPGIVRHTLVEDEYVITLPGNHPLADKGDIYFEDIRDADIIALPANTIFKIADRLFAQKDCKPNIVFEGNHRMMTKMLYLNKGFLFASRQMLYMCGHNPDIYSNNATLFPIVMRPIVDLNCRYSLSICWKEGRELPAMAWNFIHAMKTQYPDYHNDPAFLNSQQAYYPNV